MVPSSQAGLDHQPYSSVTEINVFNIFYILLIRLLPLQNLVPFAFVAPNILTYFDILLTTLSKKDAQVIF